MSAPARPGEGKEKVFSAMPALTVILNQRFKMGLLGANQAFCRVADLHNIT